MRMRPLGRTGLLVSEICLGTMTFGEQNTEEEAQAQLDHSFAAGVNFLDTAELYPIPPRAATAGRTEEIIGGWMKSRKNRDRVVVATKVVGRSDMTWFRDDGSPSRLTRQQIREAVEKSLKRLQTEWIDLYQVHWPDRRVSVFGSNPTRFRSVTPAPDEAPIAETLDVLAALVREGKIRHIGISNESAWGTMRWIGAADAGQGPRILSIQNAYNLLNRTFEGALAEIALQEGVGLLAYSPLAQGYLTGKYQNNALPPGSRKQLFNRLQRYETAGAHEAIDLYLAIARAHGVDPAAFAIAFALAQPFVASVIIGATTLDQLNVALAATGISFTREMQAAVDKVHQRVGNPCP